MKRVTYGLMLLTLVAGCSSMNITTDFDPGADFSTFETFQYKESDQSLSTSSPLTDRRIVDAITREITASGLTEADSEPDVYVTYYTSTQDQLQFNTVYTGVGTGWGRWGWRGGMSSSQTRATTWTEGTIVIDVWDASENQLVWRGVVTDTIRDNPDKNAATIDRGVERVFTNFPPS